jgi:two-component system NarL family sensor kinase
LAVYSQPMNSQSLLVLGLVLVCISCRNPNASNVDPKSASYAESQLSLAAHYLKSYQTDSAELILTPLIGEETKAQYPQMYLQAQLNLGKIYGDRGDNVTALSHYQEALKMAETIPDEAKIPLILKNIGVLYVQWKRFDEALDYYNQAEKFGLALGDEELVADCQNNKGVVYEQQEAYDQALAAYQEALAHYQAKNLPAKIAMAYSNIAIVHKLQKEYQKSIDYNLKAIELLDNDPDKWSISAIYNNIGNLYGEIGNYALAIDYCSRSLKIAQEIRAEEIIGMAYKSMANAAANARDFEKAYAYHQDYVVSNDKFINEENTRQLSELNIRYETEKKEKQIAEAKLISQQKDLWLILLAGGGIFGLAVFRNYRIKVQHKQEQLGLENALLKEQTHSKIQEQRLEISRDLHDTLGAQLTFINSILESLKNASSKLDETLNSKVNLLSDFSANSISELRNTLWVLNAKEIYLEDLKSKILNFISQASNATEDLNFNFNFDVVDNLNLNSKQAVNLFRAIQEIINNAIKYAQAEEIKIDIQQHQKHLSIKIADDGVGFDVEKERNKSYGLANIESRIKAINAQIQLESKLNQGTSYQILMEI